MLTDVVEPGLKSFSNIWRHLETIVMILCWCARSSLITPVTSPTGGIIFHPWYLLAVLFFFALAMIAFCSRFPPFFSWLLMQEDFCSMAASIPALLNKDAVVRRQNNKKNKSCTSSTSTAVTSEQQHPKYWHDRWSARVQHPLKLPARIAAMINNRSHCISIRCSHRVFCFQRRLVLVFYGSSFCFHL